MSEPVLYSNWEEFFTVVTTGVSTGTGNEMSYDRQQKLIHLMFEIAIKAYWWADTNPDVEPDQIADWVRKALRDSGFNVSDGIGSSWGELNRQSPYISPDDSENTGGISIVSAERPD
jgi:hypothetical protein